MPFLLIPTKILFYIRRKINNLCLKIIIIFNVVFIFSSLNLHILFISLFDNPFKNDGGNQKYFDEI